MMRHVERLVGALLVLLTGSTWWGSAEAQSAPVPLPQGITPAVVAQGKVLYESTGLCMACHGMDGKGGVGPDLTDGVLLHPDGSVDSITALLIRGIPEAEAKTGIPMPSREGTGLDDNELRAVAAYVWTLSRSVVLPSREGRRR
ncbi:MAG: cytochrome c [Gemmatimonadales bacterium]|nr:cytochrome c [Gemmatimonadales bacterium]